jgi:hypothetical protein
MKRISSFKIYVNFGCLSCKHTTQIGLPEVVEDGSPECEKCGDSMEMIDCDIDTNEC